MGLMSFIKSQLIDIIEWLDDTNYTLVWRFPDQDHEVKNGAKLICRPGQAAVLVNEGKAADVFGPGTHTLSTQNVPILSTLRGWKYGFESPFKVEVYFINLRQYLDQKWGTANPVLIRDPEFAVAGRPGRVRIRAYGSYNFKITEPRLFFDEIVGTQGLVTTDEIESYLKPRAVSAFSMAAGKSELSVADMAGHYDVLANAVRGTIEEDFKKIGITLTSFLVENISLPPEVEKALDAAAAQSARGVDNTMQWEGMQAVRDAARQPGGGGGMMQAGMGLGMGVGMGQMMSGVMGQAIPQPGYPQGYPPPQGYPQQGYPPPQGYPQQQQTQGQHQQPPPTQSQGAPGGSLSLEDRLRALKAAFDAQLITEDEYKNKRAQLLGAL
jgi:membrane protease subunit (stomatin/prohibitin family)